jgi:hypothetical protein
MNADFDNGLSGLGSVFRDLRFIGYRYTIGALELLNAMRLPAGRRRLDNFTAIPRTRA